MSRLSRFGRVFTGFRRSHPDVGDTAPQSRKRRVAFDTPGGGIEPLEGRLMLATDQPLVGVNLGGLRYWTPDWVFTDAMKQASDWNWDWVNSSGQKLGGETAGDPQPTLDAKGWPVQLATKVIGGQTATQRLISHIYTGFDEGHFPEGTYHVTWSGTAALHFGGDASGETNRTANSVDFKVNDARTGITMFVDGFNQANPVKDIHIWLPDWTDPDDSTKTYHFGTTSFQPPAAGSPAGTTVNPSPFHPLFLKRVAPFSNLRFMEWGDTNRVAANSWSERRLWDAATQAFGKSDSVKKGVAYEYWAELANETHKDVWISIPHTFGLDTYGSAANDPDVQAMAQFFHDRLDPGLKVYVEWSNEIWNSLFDVHDDIVAKSNATGTPFWDITANLVKRDLGTWSSVFADAPSRLVRVVAGQAGSPDVLQGLLSRINNPNAYDALAAGGYAGTDIYDPKMTPDDIARVAYNAVPGAVARLRWNMDVRDQYAPGKPFLVYEGGQGVVRHSVSDPVAEAAFKKSFIAAQDSPIMEKAYRNLMQGMSEIKLDLFSHFTLSGNWDDGAYGALRWEDVDTRKYKTLAAPDLYFPDFRVEAIQPVASESNGQSATFRIWRSGHIASGATVPVTFSFGGTAIKGTDYNVSATVLNFTSADAVPYKDVTVTPIGDSIAEPEETLTLTLDDGGAYNIDPDLYSASARLVDDDDGWTRQPLTVQNANFDAGLANWAGSDFNVSNGAEVAASPQTPRWAVVTNGNNEVDLAPRFGQGGAGSFAWASGSAGRTDSHQVQYLTQNVDVSSFASSIDAGGAKVLVTAWAAGGGYRLDNGKVRVRFVNASGALIAGAETDGKAVSTFQQWLPSVADASVPAGTRQVQIQLRAQNLPGDLSQNVGFDNVSAVLRFPGGGGPQPLPSVAVAATDAAAAEAGLNPGTFTFTRSGDLSAALTVNYTVSGSASNGNDYNASPALTGSITFNATESAKTVTITPVDDTQVEGDEQATLTLSPGATYTINPAPATVTIADNDNPPPPPTGGTNIVANFTGGVGSASSDQYRGIAGQGWLDGWGLSSYNDRIVMSGDTTQTASPLSGGGTYLNAPLVPNSTGTDVRTATLYRPYASANGVDTSKPYRIEFDYRLDSSTATFTTLEDRVNLFGDGQALYGTGPTNTWSVVALGAAGYGARAKTFGFGTGNWTQNTAGNQLVDTGVALVQNKVYHITIDNDPAAHQYKAAITDGTASFQSGTLAWRPSAANYGATTPTYLHYGAHVDGATEGLTFSLDSVKISPAGQSQALAPTDDAHVTGGSFAGNNNATTPDILVKYNATFADQTKEAYFKFDTSSVTGSINGVKLRLYGRVQDTRAANVPVSAYAVPTTTWTEGTLTWNNKPASSGAALSTVTVTDDINRWYEFDLTNYVRSERAAGRNVFSIVLKTTTATQPSISFASKDTTGTASDPQLIVQTGAGASSGTAKATQDALVTGGTSSTTNYGSLGVLRVKLNNTSPDLTRNSLLTFDTSSLPAGVLSNVKLRLYGSLNGTGSTNVPVSVYGVADTTWSEGAITWDTQPTADATGQDTQTIVDDVARWYEWDVTAWVNQQRAAGNTLVGLMLKADDESVPYAVFNSDEAASNTPELVGTVSAATSVSATNDARVNAGASSGTNYGAAPDLIVKQNAAFPDQTRESYLTFDTTGVAGTLQSVKLRLNGRMEDARAGNVAVGAYGVSDTSWSEDSITWDTKPAAGATSLASATVTDDVSRWYEWDLTAYVNQERAAGRTVVSIVLKTATETPNKIIFNSAEAAADRPELVMIA